MKQKLSNLSSHTSRTQQKISSQKPYTRFYFTIQMSQGKRDSMMMNQKSKLIMNIEKDRPYTISLRSGTMPTPSYDLQAIIGH